MIRKFLIITFTLFYVSGFAADFTVASYNCGGLSDHYDYIRAVCMQKLVQERSNQEPEIMAQLKKIQDTALKIRFSHNMAEKQEAEKEWSQNHYTELFNKITSNPSAPNSINRIWREKSEAIVTSYQERPVAIFDKEVEEILQGHLHDLVQTSFPRNKSLNLARKIMAKRIFKHDLKYDIIALQEADYLDPTLFPEEYEVHLSKTNHSINGIAWKKSKIELIEEIGNIDNRGYALKLRDRETQEIIAIASVHLSGCNPFHQEINPETNITDSAKGDLELTKIIQALNQQEADIRLIAMDSNVTATHPRLNLLIDAGYTLDYTNSLEPTCTSPWQILNTRIDWIAIQSPNKSTTIHNIPIHNINLNNPRTNISDHKPIATKISR